MCKDCSKFVEMCKSLGMTEDEIMCYLWNETPFPIGPPTVLQKAMLISTIIRRNHDTPPDGTR